MTQTITRMYDSADRANAAAHDLRHNRVFMFEDVHVIAAGPGANPDGIVDAITKAMVLKAHARVFAEGVKRGSGLVVVHAPFGCAEEALNILARHGPIDSGVPDDREPPIVWDEAAPLSSAFHFPVLMKDSATFSSFWNVPPLLRGGRTTGAGLGLPEIKASRGPYAPTIGLPLLSSKASPLSSMLGLPLLTKAKSRH